MDQETLIERIFSGEENLSTEIYEGRMEHLYSVRDSSGYMIGENIGMSAARDLRDMMRMTFGGTYDIIETKTLTRDGRELFSGNISETLSHVSSHVPSHDGREDDPMFVEYYMFDVRAWATELFAERDPVEYSPGVPMPLPSSHPKVTRAKIARGNLVKSVERVYSGASSMPEEILMARGYALFDAARGEIVYAGTKSMVVNFIETRTSKDVPKSDRLRIENIKIVQYAKKEMFVANLVIEGYVATHGGRVIGFGLRDDLTKIITTYVKEHKIKDAKKVLHVEKISSSGRAIR